MEINISLENLAIITLNYNSYKKVVNQVDLLLNENTPKSCFYIIDNLSTDKDQLKKYCDLSGLHFIQNTINGGFAQGNNIAIKKAIDDKKEYFLILNPDIEISLLTIKKLLFTLTNDPSIGIIGPRILDKFDRNLIFSDGGLLFPDKGFLGDHLHYNKTIQEFPAFGINYDLNYVNGSAMMHSIETLIQNGYMREDFFMYYEESEWCYRLQTKTSLKLAINTDVVVYHEMSEKKYFYHYYLTRNRIWITRLYNGNKRFLYNENIRDLRRSIKKLNFKLIRPVVEGWFKDIK